MHCLCRVTAVQRDRPHASISFLSARARCYIFQKKRKQRDKGSAYEQVRDGNISIYLLPCCRQKVERREERREGRGGEMRGEVRTGEERIGDERRGEGKQSKGVMCEYQRLSVFHGRIYFQINKGFNGAG